MQLTFFSTCLKLQDINDNPPTFQGFSNSAEVNVQENTMTGTTIFTVRVFHLDLSNQFHWYDLGHMIKNLVYCFHIILYFCDTLRSSILYDFRYVLGTSDRCWSLCSQQSAWLLDSRQWRQRYNLLSYCNYN